MENVDIHYSRNRMIQEGSDGMQNRLFRGDKYGGYWVWLEKIYNHMNAITLSGEKENRGKGGAQHNKDLSS